MNIETQLLAGAIANALKNELDGYKIDSNKIVNSMSLCALIEIREVVQNKKGNSSDLIVEGIETVLKKYGVN